MKHLSIGKKYCDITGKIHLPCPFTDKSGINVHVVIKDGYCYRSEDCLILECKYNKTQTDIKKILSLIW